MADAAAARVGDPVGHDWGMLGMIGGAVLGAVVAGALIGATVVTGGAAAVAVAGLVAGGALAGGQLADGLQTVLGAQNPTTGVLVHGSPDVFINGRPAVRAGPDFVAACSGLFMTHHLRKPNARVAEGSDHVAINGHPAARVGDRLECAATVTTGSPNVRIGGNAVAVLPITDNRATWTQVAAVVGLVALGGGAVVAALAGATALAGFAAVGAGFYGLNAGLGWVGDRLGPGWRDVLQGGAGIAGIVATPAAARAAQARAARVQALRGGTPAASAPGLETRGYRPQPGERSTTRAQWKASQSEARAQATTARIDQPLEQPNPNMAQHGHGHADHGYQTTAQQQGDRIRTGVTPSGRVANPPPRASSYSSPAAEAEAVGRARRALDSDLAAGTVRTYPDPVTGSAGYVRPNGAPVRHTITVETKRPGGFGNTVVQREDPLTGAVMRDASGAPLTVRDPTPRTQAKVVWEYAPSSGTWRVVTSYPTYP